MSIPLPDSAEASLTRPGDLRWMTRLALSQALRELAEASLALIPTFGEDGLQAGAYSSYARRVMAMTRRARVLAVLNDRLVLGAGWDTIDRYLRWPPGQAERVFAEMETRWKQGDTTPWAPVLDAADLGHDLGAELGAGRDKEAAFYPLDLSDPMSLVADLDRFCAVHIRPDPHDRGPKYQRRRQVSGGLPY